MIQIENAGCVDKPVDSHTMYVIHIYRSIRIGIERVQKIYTNRGRISFIQMHSIEIPIIFCDVPLCANYSRSFYSYLID